MAQVHNELRRGAIGPALLRALGVTDPDAALERFSETLQPVIDLWGLPEWAWLRNERLAGHVDSVPAVVGEFGAFGFINPSASNTLMVVDQLTCDSGSTKLVYHVVPLSQADIVATLLTDRSLFATIRDTRWAAPGRALIVRGSDPAAETFGAERLVSADQLIARSNQPYVLSPGFGLMISSQTTNVAFNFSVQWRERNALPGELD